MSEETLSCDNCDKEFLPDDGIEYDTHNSCNECIEEVEKY